MGYNYKTYDIKKHFSYNFKVLERYFKIEYENNELYDQKLFGIKTIFSSTLETIDSNSGSNDSISIKKHYLFRLSLIKIEFQILKKFLILIILQIEMN